MELYKYSCYKEYKDSQISKSLRKQRVWVKRGEIDIISNHAILNIPKINFGICHGVRTGFEVEKFRARLKVNIIGTDIYGGKFRRRNLIEWDFHNIKDEWVGSVDFIYSNALDHSYDPKYCLSQWMKCLSENGICYIHWGKDHSAKIDKVDCFSATKNEYKSILFKDYLMDEFKTITTNKGSRTVFALRKNGRFKYNNTREE